MPTTPTPHEASPPCPHSAASNSNQDINLAALQQLAAVQGQLNLITQIIQQHHESTNLRIEDFRKSVDGRFTGIEGRLGTLEKNERGTALRTAGMAALTSAIVAAAFASMKLPRP